MDADDVSKPDRLEKQTAFLRKYKKYALVGCGVELIGADGVWGRRIPEEIPEKKSFLSTSPFTRKGKRAPRFRRAILPRMSAALSCVFEKMTSLQAT